MIWLGSVVMVVGSVLPMTSTMSFFVAVSCSVKVAAKLVFAGTFTSVLPSFEYRMPLREE